MLLIAYYVYYYAGIIGQGLLTEAFWHTTLRQMHETKTRNNTASIVSYSDILIQRWIQGLAKEALSLHSGSGDTLLSWTFAMAYVVILVMTFPMMQLLQYEFSWTLPILPSKD